MPLSPRRLDEYLVYSTGPGPKNASLVLNVFELPTFEVWVLIQIEQCSKGFLRRVFKGTG